MARTAAHEISAMSSANPSGSVSGAAMDRRIDNRKQRWKSRSLGLLFATIVLCGLFAFWQANGARQANIDTDKLVISTVTLGAFEDYIPIRGSVTPKRTVYLDAMEGGRVEKVLIEDGAIVAQGQLLAELSNTGLLLDVTRNEALIAEQLNTMRTLELQLEQNRLAHKRNLVELEYQIKKLSRQLKRQRVLVTTKALPVSLLEDTEDEIDYLRQRLQVTKESQQTDARMQEQQLLSLKDTEKRLYKNLEISRRNLDGLNLRAPIAGKLSGFSIEVGQSISAGGRIGQIDEPDHFKVTALIDEFYLRRVDLDQLANYEERGKRRQMRVSKIYPQVTDGQFQIDMEFVGAPPNSVRRGQTIQAKLTLGAATQSLILPNRAFYQDTGGHWVFVVDDTETIAARRSIKTGRRNTHYIEITEGLDAGEKVITSPYSGFTDMERLVLNER